MNDTVTGVEKFVDAFIDIAAVYGLDLVQAGLILIAGYWLAAKLCNLVRRRLDRIERIDATLKPLFANLVRYIVLIFTIIAVLAQFGVQTASIIAVLGAAGLAIGLALQGTLQNISAGIMLLFLRPFKVGDVIEAAGHLGTVMELGLFSTEFRTGQGICIFVPNAALWGSSITNYSRNDTRRVDVVVGISYDDDIDKARETLLGLMNGDDRILDDPAPETMVVALADSSVNINMRCWVKGADYWGTLFALNQAAKVKLEAAGCSIPYPQRDVHMISEGQT